MKRWGFLMVLAACSSQNPMDLYGQWENPEKRLTAYPSYSDYGSFNNAWTIAVRDTMVHIVWEHRLSSGVNPGELYYIRSINSGSSFDPDTRLTTGNSHYPSVAVCDSIVHIVWCDLRAGNYKIYYKRSVDNGATWGDDERLTHDPAGSWYPSVAVRDSIVHIVWCDSRNSNPEIYYKRSVDNGKTWGIDKRLTNDSFYYSGHPSIAVHGSIVHVVWYNLCAAGNYEIYYKRSVNNGENWGIINERLTNNSADSECPSVAVRDSIVHVVWHDECAGSWEIYYKRSVDNGKTWGIEERLTTDPDGSKYPSVAVHDSIVHIVWRDWRAGAGNTEIYYNRSVNDGETWGIIDERLTNALASSYYPSVACWDCSYDYDVHVTWTDERAGRPEIYYKRHKCEGTSVEESKELKVKSLEFRVFPNPFTQKTVIRYSLNGNRNDYTINDLRLTIHDITGRIVKTLVNEERKAGCYDVSFDAKDLTAGIYFAKLVAHTGLTTGDFKETKKLILMR